MKLYEINIQIETLLEQYYNCFDEDWAQIVTDEEVEVIRSQLNELENKKDDFKNWILQKRQNDLSDIQGIDNEIARLSELKKERQNKVKKWENFIKYLFWDLEKPIMFWNFKIWYRKSKSVEVTDTFDNKEYMKEKVTYLVDKTAIKKALENWEKIDWAIIKENFNFYIK